MNNIVKIILGLNIAAGIAALIFGAPKIGKAKTLKKDKDDAAVALVVAKQGKSDADGKLKTEQGRVATLQGEKANLELAKSNLEKSAGGAQGQIDAANNAKDVAIIERDTAKSLVKGLQQLADKVPNLEGDLADYKNINFRGEKLSPAEIQIKLAQLENLTKGPTGPRKPKTKTMQDGDLIGAIQSHDAALDFYVINAGRDNGIKIGDQFLITGINSSKPLGYIQISRVQPSVSIAVYKKGFPRPAAPFQNGYKVWKSSL